MYQRLEKINFVGTHRSESQRDKSPRLSQMPLSDQERQRYWVRRTSAYVLKYLADINARFTVEMGKQNFPSAPPNAPESESMIRPIP